MRTAPSARENTVLYSQLKATVTGILFLVLKGFFLFLRFANPDLCQYKTVLTLLAGYIYSDESNM